MSCHMSHHITSHQYFILSHHLHTYSYNHKTSYITFYSAGFPATAGSHLYTRHGSIPYRPAVILQPPITSTAAFSDATVESWEFFLNITLPQDAHNLVSNYSATHERHGVSNHWQINCFLIAFWYQKFPHHWPFVNESNGQVVFPYTEPEHYSDAIMGAMASQINGELPAQMVSNAENVSIWWRHHDAYMSTHIARFMVR